MKKSLVLLGLGAMLFGCSSAIETTSPYCPEPSYSTSSSEPMHEESSLPIEEKVDEETSDITPVENDGWYEAQYISYTISETTRTLFHKKEIRQVYRYSSTDGEHIYACLNDYSTLSFYDSSEPIVEAKTYTYDGEIMGDVYFEKRYFIRNLYGIYELKTTLEYTDLPEANVLSTLDGILLHINGGNSIDNKYKEHGLSVSTITPLFNLTKLTYR